MGITPNRRNVANERPAIMSRPGGRASLDPINPTQHVRRVVIRCDSLEFKIVVTPTKTAPLQRSAQRYPSIF